MSETLPPPLPASLTALLDAERARAELSDAAKERILERLHTSVDGPRPPRSLRTVLGAFAGGLLLGAALVGAFLGGRPGRVQPKLLVLDSPVPPPPVVVVVRTATPAASTPLPPSTLPTPHAPPSRPAAAPPAAEDEHDTELARERALIETARTALSRKQPDAIDLLLRHAQQFPHGRLAEERESLLVQALLQAGRIEEARSRGARFRARWPRSLLLPIIDAALGTIS